MAAPNEYPAAIQEIPSSDELVAYLQDSKEPIKSHVPLQYHNIRIHQINTVFTQINDKSSRAYNNPAEANVNRREKMGTAFVPIAYATDDPVSTHKCCLWSNPIGSETIDMSVSNVKLAYIAIAFVAQNVKAMNTYIKQPDSSHTDRIVLFTEDDAKILIHALIYFAAITPKHFTQTGSSILANINNIIACIHGERTPTPYTEVDPMLTYLVDTYSMFCTALLPGCPTHPFLLSQTLASMHLHLNTAFLPHLIHPFAKIITPFHIYAGIDEDSDNPAQDTRRNAFPANIFNRLFEPIRIAHILEKFALHAGK